MALDIAAAGSRGRRGHSNTASNGSYRPGGYRVRTPRLGGLGIACAAVCALGGPWSRGLVIAAKEVVGPL